MKIEHKVLGLYIIFGFSFWILDVVLDYFVFSERTFLESFAIGLSYHEIYMRSISIAFLLLFGIILSKILEDRGRLEKLLNECEQRVHVMFDSSHDLLTVAERDGKTILANPSWFKTLGYSLKTQGNPIENIHPGDRKRVIEAWVAMEHDDKAFTNLKYRYKTASGDYVFLETTVRELIEEGKQKLYVSAHDITDHNLSDTNFKKCLDNMEFTKEKHVDGVNVENRSKKRMVKKHDNKNQLIAKLQYLISQLNQKSKI